MQINQATMPLVTTLRLAGKVVKLRGWHHLLKFIFPPHKQRDFRFQVPFEGLVYPGAANRTIDWKTLLYGVDVDEYASLRAMANVADGIAGAVYLDAGANVGHHALFMARHAAWVHAFEPWPTLWPAIQEKVDLNRLSNLIIHRVGLGEGDGELKYYPPASINVGTGSFVGTDADTEYGEPIGLPVVNGDRYLAREGIDRVDIIKIDVEGFEPQVLRGLSDTLGRCRPLVCIEIGPKNAAAFADLARLGSFLPEGYEFHVHWRSSALLVRHRLVPLTEELLRRLHGIHGVNVLCAPAEKPYHEPMRRAAA